MILQPAWYRGKPLRGEKSLLLCSLLTKGLHQKTAQRSANVQPTLCVSKQRRQLNAVIEEIRGLGEVPLPRRLLRVAPVYKRHLQYLRPNDDDVDITPLLYGQLVSLTSEMQLLIEDRETFSWSTANKLREVLLGLHPTVGQVDALGDFPGLVCVFPNLLDRAVDGSFFTTDFVSSFLCTPKTPKECKDFLEVSRSSLLLKILEVTQTPEICDDSTPWQRLHQWGLLDLGIKLGATPENDRSRVIGSFLEVLALVRCSTMEVDGETRLTMGAILLDAVLGDSWQPRFPLSGWMALHHLLEAPEAQVACEAFLPTVSENQMTSTQEEFLSGLQFGMTASYGSVPSEGSNLALPGPFLVQKGLLHCLLSPRWLCPNSVLRSRFTFAEVPQKPLNSLVKRAKKEYQKATRLVNLTLKLVTELAAEEGIQLSEEEKTRLLQDIAASDRRGVMSRAWESSPIKGSVPTMIQNFTKKPFSFNVHIPTPVDVLVSACIDTSHTLLSACAKRLVGETVSAALKERRLGPSINYHDIQSDFAVAYEAAIKTEREKLQTLGLQNHLQSAVMSYLVHREQHPVPQRLPRPSLIHAYEVLASVLDLPPTLPLCKTPA
ncbi:MAG: hypothetical protein KVP17_004300 [Porospora cf. gigantea B]|uniref:uncharacterized protein n=1 Tax=Porospora cf. gigantea B TaxID=2853592 RepID=UPI0035717C7B|nr:MAG: hypothetical protein KVP17_004300 [Porospora cf. gigantea B]